MNSLELKLLTEVVGNVSHIRAEVGEGMHYTSSAVLDMLKRALRVKLAEGKYGTLKIKTRYDDGDLMGVFVTIVDDDGGEVWSKQVAP